MEHERHTIKDAFRRFGRFFCTGMPVISLLSMGLCWLIYLRMTLRSHKSINEYGHGFWIVMNILCRTMMISGALFFAGLIAYMIYRPLPGKRNRLHILLRILICAAAGFITACGVWISVFTFSGAGY